MDLELLRSDCFHVEIDGISRAGFLRCEGLSAMAGVVEYAEGGYPGVRLFRDRLAPGRLVLERGLARDRELWEWFVAGDPRPGAILLLDARGAERCRWSFEDGWPCRWQGPRLEALDGEVALELVEIAHGGLRCHLA
jgi:phage tail-like protein